MNLDPLAKLPRLLIEAKLAPLQGSRFQPTGFPDLGAALFDGPDGAQTLLVESAQSMANRLEAVCWDEATDTLVSALDGLSYVEVHDQSEAFLTSSILESHRLNSPYIIEGSNKAFLERLTEELDYTPQARLDLRKLASVLFKYDINSLIHGIFLAKKDLAGGRMRLPRALSAFIEATNVKIAPSGGVKFDAVDPSGDTKKGFGNVPFHREEFTGDMTAYFNLDLSQLRGYGFDPAAERLLTVLSLYKIQRFLLEGLRLRTACDLRVDGPVRVTNLDGFELPSVDELERELATAIAGARHLMATPPVTTHTYSK